MWNSSRAVPAKAASLSFRMRRQRRKREPSARADPETGELLMALQLWVRHSGQRVRFGRQHADHDLFAAFNLLSNRPRQNQHENRMGLPVSAIPAPNFIGV